MAEQKQCCNLPTDSDLHEISFNSCSSSSSSSAIVSSSCNSISEKCSASFSCGSLGSSDRNGTSSARSSISYEWPLISSVCNASKPHKANDAAWEAIRSLRCREGSIGPAHFRLLHKLGSGDIGKVYLCQLKGADQNCLYAMKMVDKEALAHRNKAHRAEIERQILSALDHPFLPTLYAHFETSHYSCLVMEFCSGGDLHSLRLRQQANRFGLHSARFYAAEVLLAVEYLHMVGVIYRDLKPENVLVRGNGHIMLSDFDLSLRCHVTPTLQKTFGLSESAEARNSSSSSSAARPSAISCSASMLRCNCLPKKEPRLASRGKEGDRRAPRPEFVAEPAEARSRSFVGTHEYLAPEVISGKGHGSAVDWWSLGILLYEMLYATTPFKGATKEKTLLNIITQPLRFPERDPSQDWELARDLIRRLLVKDPRRRLGSARGAADITKHPFFEGINWALIRSAPPPGIHGPGIAKSSSRRQKRSLEIPPYFEYF